MRRPSLPNPARPEEGAGEAAAGSFARLVEIMQRLRGPDGCPWDREQDHSSISLNLIEEAYETVEAIDRGDDAELKEELGDLLLQVVFHAEIAAGQGRFDIKGVVEDLVEKLILRHPHVFGDRGATTPDAGEVLANWEAIKREQKGRDVLEEGIPPGLPALIYAHKALRRLAGVGRQYEPSPQRLAALAAKAADGLTEQLAGEILFEAAALAKDKHLDPEGALRKHVKSRLDS